MRQLKISRSITNREAVSMSKYLNELSQIPLISLEEEVKLALKVKAGDSRAKEKLVNANLRFVVSVAKQYQNRGISLQDLIQFGNEGLIVAAEKFDPTVGVKFISYAVWWIRQAITREINENSEAVRLPLNKVNAINKIKKASRVVFQKEERAPTIEELLELTGLPENQIKSAQLAEFRSFSMDESFSGQDDFDDYKRQFKSQEFDLEENIKKEDANIMLNSLLATIDDRGSQIIKMSFGVAGFKKMSLEEIGEVVGLTSERVRQLKSGAIRKLRKKVAMCNKEGIDVIPECLILE